MKARLQFLRTLLFRLGILTGLVLLAIQIFQAYQAFQNQVIFIQNDLALGLAGIVIVLSFLQQIGAWVLLMRALGIPLPIHKAQYIYSLSFLARYIPGSIWGYLSRSEWLMQDYQVSYTASNYGSVLEVALEVLVGFSVVGFGIISSKMLVPTWIGYLLLILPWLPWALWFSKFSLGWKWKLAGYLKNDVLSLNPHLRDWAVILILLTINCFYYGLGVFLIGFSLGVWRVDQLFSLWTVLSGDFSVAWLAGFFAIFIPSGLGVRELVLSSLLVHNLQLAESVARAISVMMRLITVLAEFATILITSVLYFYIERKEKAKTR